MLFQHITQSILPTALAASMALSTAAAQPVAVREIGSFHIGGREVTLSGLPTREIVFTPGAPPFRVDPNGQFEAEPMYVQYTRLANPRARYPLLMWHGGGLSGVTWESTPDGRPGWQMFFLRQGHDVFVSDAVERGRAGWSRYPEIYSTEPFFRAKSEAWTLFRIGREWNPDATQRVAFTGNRFPVLAFDQFMRQGVPRWATNDAATQRAYDALVQRVCPCVIMVHSQGGNFGFTAALNAPDKVRALIAVEPSGSPDLARVDVTRLRNIPHLFVWGDFLEEQALWAQILPRLIRYKDALTNARVPVDWLSLPGQGITGNSHMLMMDTNSDQIAGLVQQWMARRGLMRR